METLHAYKKFEFEPFWGTLYIQSKNSHKLKSTIYTYANLYLIVFAEMQAFC